MDNKTPEVTECRLCLAKGCACYKDALEPREGYTKDFYRENRTNYPTGKIDDCRIRQEILKKESSGQ